MTWNCTIPKGLIAFATRQLQKKCILRNGFVFFLFNSETNKRIDCYHHDVSVRCQDSWIVAKMTTLKTLQECKKQTMLQFWQHHFPQHWSLMANTNMCFKSLLDFIFFHFITFLFHLVLRLVGVLNVFHITPLLCVFESLSRVWRTGTGNFSFF